MKKQVSKITLALAFFSAFASFSQESQVQKCNTYAAMEEHFLADPQARANFEKSQKDLLEQSEKSLGKPSQAFEYTVPVVFHILYECGLPTVTDADCITALSQINNDYARKSSDTNLIFAPFKASYINSEIKFMLAKKDPSGNCISGIVRHQDAKTNWSQSGASNNLYWPYTWDPTKYLNIYIVNNIVPQGTVTGGGIIVGYTYIPGTWGTGNPHDAIVYRGSYLTGGGNNPNSRSLSHEIGHWLGLPHTFGNTNNPGVSCGDDGITDTPVTKGDFATCPASSTNPNAVCQQNLSVYYSNVENIMNYSSCPRNFTTGQTAVMRNTLAGTTSNRQNLWQPNSLISTGVNNSGVCAPVADFITTTCNYTLCAGQSLNFKDLSWNGSVVSFQWAADNSALVASPTNSATSILFPIIGTSDVTLTVTNAQGSSTRVKTVTILDPTPAVVGAYMESFENPGLPPDWQINDLENDGLTWEQTNLVAYDQSNCYFINGEVLPPSSTDMLIMPMMDIKNNPGSKLDFAYAYRQEASSQNDVLKVQGSKDCGGSWQDIVVLSANVMASGSGGVGSTAFYPTINEWKIYSISTHPNWNNYTNSSSVLVRFNFIEGTNGYGNNIFIDAVNFSTAPVGVNELTKSVGFALYPNPTSGDAYVRFNLDDPATVKITVLDILGKEVNKVTEAHYAAGEQSIQVNAKNNLPKGVYFVNMSVNGATMSGKLVIN